MRSLKRLYEIVKQYHTYWNIDGHSEYMCYATEYAYTQKTITLEERKELTKDIKKFVRFIDSSSISLVGALGQKYPNKAITEVVVIDTWEAHINSLE